MYLKIEEKGPDPDDPRKYVSLDPATYVHERESDLYHVVLYIPNACGGETRITIGEYEPKNDPNIHKLPW